MELNKLGVTGNSYYVALPKGYVTALGWVVGDYIVIQMEAQSLILTKIGLIKEEKKQ